MATSDTLYETLSLPNFSTLAELSRLLHIDENRLNQYIRFNHRYYLKYKILKSNGKYRNIQQPNKSLKAIQAWILSLIHIS
ncbi:MAG: NUMOD1 domain-containing DNA-binding protein, partial [Methanosarcina sp.]|nr:NUMOD1 domain-containing DNA-binding protein [Methanosarcina sp.]